MVDIDANIINTYGRPRDTILVAAVNPDGSPIGAGGGSSEAIEALLTEIRDQNFMIITLLGEISQNTATT